MLLRDLFINGLKIGNGFKREWCNALFYITEQTRLDYEYDYQVFINNGRMYTIVGNSDPIYITDYVSGRLPIHMLDRFVLQPNEVLNYKGDGPLITTYGNVYCNHQCLVYPFQDIIPFQAGQINWSKIESMILERRLDNPPDFPVSTLRNIDWNNPPPRASDGKIYVWQYLAFAELVLFLPIFSEGYVTNTSPKSMTYHPDRDRVRAELEAKYAGKLHDPAIVAEIGKVYEALDKEHLAGDDVMKFYSVNPGKLIGSVRKKLYYMFGAESPFSDGTRVEYIGKSLQEQLDRSKLPVIFNSLRFGSYNRGANTALGGEKTKTIYRMVGTVRMVEQDCGDTLGTPLFVAPYLKDSIIGFTYIQNGQLVEIDAAKAESLVNTLIRIRDPMTCKSGRDLSRGTIGEGKNVCCVCMGKAIAENPNGIPAAAANIGGRFLSTFLSLMHATALRTEKWDYKQLIS